MDKPKRTPEANAQIRTAREMPRSPGDGAERYDDREDSQQCKDAERPTPSHPGAPNKLPGYGGGR